MKNNDKGVSTTQLMDYAEVGARLGVRPGVVRFWVMSKHLDSVRLSHKIVRIPVDAVDKLISTGRRPGTV
jgi:hypothetical protein